MSKVPRISVEELYMTFDSQYIPNVLLLETLSFFQSLQCVVLSV